MLNDWPLSAQGCPMLSNGFVLGAKMLIFHFCLLSFVPTPCNVDAVFMHMLLIRSEWIVERCICVFEWSIDPLCIMLLLCANIAFGWVSVTALQDRSHRTTSAVGWRALHLLLNANARHPSCSVLNVSEQVNTRIVRHYALTRVGRQRHTELTQCYHNQLNV